MPSIGDITGRIVIQDVGSPAAVKFGENLEKTSKAIVASMSRATLATETAVREIASKLAKLKTETKDTAAGKGLVADLDSLIKKRQQEITALKAGPAAIEALNRKRYEEAQALKIAAAQVQAGVSAESHLGRVIATNIKTLDRYEKELDDLAKAQAKAAQKTEQQIAAYRKLSDVGRTLTTRVTLPLIALGAGAVKVASDFESSFAGVRKTVDATEEEFAQLEIQIRALAAGPDAIPIDVNKLNAVAEAAGQLGIAKGDIVAFTRTMADLGETTNLTADEAATATAQFQNIFGAAGKDVDRFGSTLVALGNAGASTEKDIISMGLRIAGAGVQLGLSQGEVLAYASALSSMGIEAEAGGSAISKVMIDIALAVSKGGKELANFASVSGMSADEFKLAFKEDAGGAVASFIEGLGRMKASGQDVLGTLDAMGITEIRMRDALLRASGAGDLLRNSLTLQAEAWRDNNALTTEAEKRYQTFESQLRLFLNQVKDITITFGTALLPVLLDAVDAAKPFVDLLRSMAEEFANASPGLQKFVLIVGALVAAAGPAVFITGQLLLAWSHIVTLGPGVVTSIRAVAGAMNGLFLVSAGLIGVGLLINGIINKWREASDAVTQYNLEVGKIEGNALAFARQVSQGALYGTVTQATFDEKIKEADILAGHIKRISAEVDNLNQAIKTGAGDQAYLAKQKLPEKEQELKNLWAAHNKLRSALAGVTIAGEKAEEAFNPSPFGGLAVDSEKARDIIAELTAELLRQTQALALLQQGIPIERIENLVSAAQDLEKTNLFDPLVRKVADLKDRIDAIATAFELATQARDKFAEAGDDLDELIKKQFEQFGPNDPGMQELIANLREARSLTESLTADEERRLAVVGRAQDLYEQGLITATELQAILLANADQWNVELDETQLKFEQIYEQLSYIAEGIAYDLVYNWRRAWEENESIVDATVDTLRDSFLNVLQDIISQWLSAWFRAMAAWLARWIVTQRTAAAVSAASSGGGVGTSGGVGSLMGMGAQAYGAYSASGAGAGGGMSADQLYGYALAAYALYVVYKGFIEDHKRKFARVEIIDGQSQMTAWHGKKYMEGVQQAAASIIANVTKFLDEVDVTMNRLGTVIIESSKSGFNVSMSPTSTGKLFKSMEEAISYAQVLMLKYGEFADSVSLLVRSVIQSSKAITIEDLASDIAFAKELETQNLEQAALDIQRAMDLAIAQWKRAEDLFLSFYDQNLPAFAEAATSILTRLGSSLWSTFNQLAGIEEDPQKAWERQRIAYNAQRAIILAQIALWQLEIDARIKSFDAQKRILGGGGGGKGDGAGRGSGIIGVAYAALTVAGLLGEAVAEMDPALQALLDIQRQLRDIELPPELKPEDFPGAKRGGRGGGQNLADLREELRNDIDQLEAEIKGPLHSALFDLLRNIAEFTDRAKEAKLPAEEIARAVELMTRKFQEGLRAQAEAMAGFGTDFTRRLREIGAFFDQLRELGRKQTGMPNWLVSLLEGEALESLGAELNLALDQFMGLIDPMAAINAQAEMLRQNVIAYGQAAGWTAEQIDEALRQIDQGISFQRQQGVNSLLDRLFAYAKEAGIYQQEAVEHEREKALLDLQILEAQFAFYGALTGNIQDMIDRIRGFINGPGFRPPPDRSNEVISVRVVEDEADIFTDLFDNIIAAVEDWRAAIDDFAKSTQDLLTDDQLSGLTQEQQLAAARARVEDLIARAQSGDVEALAQLADARREFLDELRESEAGGFGFQEGWEWIMGETADLLANAQQGEENLIANMLEGWEVPIHRMPDLLEELNTTMYEGIAQIVDALYAALGGVPSFASGGIVMSGPRLVRVAEYIPEAIVPLDKLSTMIPYRPQPMDRVTAPGTTANERGYRYASVNERDSLARLSAVEASNSSIARSMAAIEKDISAMRRRR